MAIEKIKPGPGQESVWDYPRPPRLNPSNKRVRVLLNGVVIAESESSVRILETSHPPVYYIHPDDVSREYLRKTLKTSFCEFKGQSSYYTVEVGDLKVVNSAWYYPSPTSGYISIKNHIAFYPSKFECYVNDERVSAQAGDFYGGWITHDIVGPFKGDPGTHNW
jgi:uncharacterized protein (DUF427 family)